MFTHVSTSAVQIHHAGIGERQRILPLQTVETFVPREDYWVRDICGTGGKEGVVLLYCMS